MTSNAADRRKALVKWAALSGRRFPWRETKDAWGLLVAEMLLRRTRADQVAAIYPHVMKRFPNAQKMALSRRSTVRSSLESLGLFHRADQLQAAAREIMRRSDGHVPTTTTPLLDLPGVGPYVAAAVSIGTGQFDAVLIDTNTVRVATRYFGIETTARDVRRQKAVVEAVNALFGGGAGRIEWWAVLDLAALICRPGLPNCKECPIQDGCKTGNQQP